MSKKTYVALVVDTSGSMAEIENEAIRYYNEQVQQLKEDSVDQEILCSLVTFNGNVWERFWNQPASSLEEAPQNSLNPKGSTVWYDALNYVIDHYKETVEAGPEDAFLIISISDGEDMGSKTKYTIREKIKACEKTNQWTFTYLGCSEENLAEIAKVTGISVSNMAAFSAGSEKSFNRAANEVTCSSRGYFNNRRKGVVQTAGFYSADLARSANFMDAKVDEPVVTTFNGDPNAPVKESFGWSPTPLEASPPMWATGTGNAALDSNLASSKPKPRGPFQPAGRVTRGVAPRSLNNAPTPVKTGVFNTGRKVV